MAQMNQLVGFLCNCIDWTNVYVSHDNELKPSPSFYSGRHTYMQRGLLTWCARCTTQAQWSCSSERWKGTQCWSALVDSCVWSIATLKQRPRNPNLTQSLQLALCLPSIIAQRNPASQLIYYCKGTFCHCVICASSTDGRQRTVGYSNTSELFIRNEIDATHWEPNLVGQTLN